MANDRIYRHFFSSLSVLLFVLLCLPLMTSCESRRTIVNSLDEKEANEIVVFLSRNNIDAAKVRSAETGGAGGSKIILWDISVPSVDATEAMSILNQAGLPRRRGTNLLGIFSTVGLVPSDMEQKVRYEAGLADQIASTIRKIDGVLDAEVTISFPQEDPLNPGHYKGKITASVYVKHNGVLDDPNTHLISKIKRLVQSAVTGLNYDDVTVIPDRARFTELQAGTIGLGTEEEKQYMSIWSIIIAKQSVFRFRLIFFTFTLIILLLVLSLIWMAWKVLPLLKETGGLKNLFSLHAISLEPTKPAKTPEKAEEEAKETPEEKVNPRQMIENVEKGKDEE